jgi:hypothetical protein
MLRRAPKIVASLAFVALAAGCAADPPPNETTPDGLVRVPARSVGGVYRAPDASFNQYQRLILEPPTIEFVDDWAKNHPAVTPKEIARLRAQTIELLRDEFSRELVERGPFEFADEPAADVLLVSPAIEDLNILAPDVSVESYVTGRPVTFKLSGDLRDAQSGRVVGRVIVYHAPEQNERNELRISNRTTIAHLQRKVYADWSQLVHEAINVAKAGKPRAAHPGSVEPR